MSTKPKVSVIIPTMNDGKNLIHAIESVFLQTYKDYEIIVIDDGSTDDTKNILSSYIDMNKIKYIYQNNSGVGNARSNGVNISRGEYVAYLDSDDQWIDNEKLAKQVEFLDSNIDYVLVGTGVVNVDLDGVEINRYLMTENDEFIRRKILRINTFVNSSVLFRRSSYDKVGSSGSILEDYDLWLKLGTVGKLKNLPIYAVKFLVNFLGHGALNKKDRLNENLKLSQKYKNIYPGYTRAFLLGYFKICFYPLFKLLPLRIKGILIKLHKKL